MTQSSYPTTKFKAYIDPLFIEFIQNPDAISQEMTVSKWGGKISRHWKPEIGEDQLKITVEIPNSRLSPTTAKKADEFAGKKLKPLGSMHAGGVYVDEEDEDSK